MSGNGFERNFQRHLAKNLEQLAQSLEVWLKQEHSWPFDPGRLHCLQQTADDLNREARKLAAGKVYVILVLMGGTGVGKSTLLNALAGESIAQTGILRPTTRKLTAYIHKDLASVALPTVLLEHSVWHERDTLANKIIVDAPDLDSRELNNYRRLQQILPYADIILYVGSQEKYHDQVGWELFRQYSTHKAFAFVLNRWDECIGREQTGARPDLDWLRDLQREGYNNPLLFRVCARFWSDQVADACPAGEQFQELRRWLEAELGEKELLAIRQTNVESILRQCHEHLDSLISSLAADLDRTKRSWETILQEAAEQFLKRCRLFFESRRQQLEDVLRREASRRVSGWLARTIGWFRNWRTPAAASSAERDTYINTRLADLVNELLRDLGDTYLRHFGEHLTNRLLAEAVNCGVPAVLLDGQLRQIGETDWQGFWNGQIRDALLHWQQTAWQPHGWRRWLYSIVNWMPGRLSWLAGFAGLSVLLYRMFFSTAPYSPGLCDALYFLVPYFLVEGLSYFLAYRLSLYDPNELIRATFQNVQARAKEKLWQMYSALLEQLRQERDREQEALENMRKQVRDVLKSLEEKRQAIASVKRLYAQTQNQA